MTSSLTTRANWVWLFASSLTIIVAGAWGLHSVLHSLHVSWTYVYGALAHGYLLLGMCGWLAVRRWHTYGSLRVAPAWWALLPLLMTIAALVLLEALFINTPRQILLPVLFLSVATLAFGTDVARRLLLPSLFLYFALPQWWVINGMLQWLTARVVDVLVGLAGISAYVQGNSFQLPAGIVEVADGCSGLNYLIVSLLLVAFQSLLNSSSLRSWFLASLLAAAVAVLCNWLRVFLLIIIAYATDMQHYLIRVEHVYFGWALFLLLMWPVIHLGGRLESRKGPKEEIDRSPARVTVGPATFAAAVIASFVLMVPSFAGPRSGSGRNAELPLEEIVEAASAAPLPPNPNWLPQALGSHEERAALDWRGLPLDVYRATYAVQTPDAHVTLSGNDLLGRLWRADDSKLPPNLPVAENFQPMEQEGRLMGSSYLIWSWYEVGGVRSRSRWEAKLSGVRGILDGRRDAAIFAFARPCIPDCQGARSDMQEFLTVTDHTLRVSADP